MENDKSLLQDGVKGLIEESGVLSCGLPVLFDSLFRLSIKTKGVLIFPIS